MSADSNTTRLTETRLTESRCPYCEGRLDAASHMRKPVKPKPDDFTICLYCAQVLRFDAFLTPVKLRPGEIEAAFLANRKFADEVRLIQHAVRSVDRRDAVGTKDRPPP